MIQALHSNITPPDLDLLREHQVTSKDELYTINGKPSQLIEEKATPYLTPLSVRFIERSPYFLMSTSDADGNCDVSPKGDAPGSVRVLDMTTLAIPDRLGNRRIDSHRNIIENPHIGLIFIIPGADESLRVNGRAFITTEPALMSTLEMQGRPPKLATIVEIDEVYMHCARSFLRSGLWNPSTWPDPDTIPTLAAIMAEQNNLPAPDESAGKRREEYRKVLY